jgi:hypothetical protein
LAGHHYHSTGTRQAGDGWIMDGELTLHRVTQHVPSGVEANGSGPDPNGTSGSAFPRPRRSTAVADPCRRKGPVSLKIETILQQ